MMAQRYVATGHATAKTAPNLGAALVEAAAVVLKTECNFSKEHALRIGMDYPRLLSRQIVNAD